MNITAHTDDERTRRKEAAGETPLLTLHGLSGAHGLAEDLRKVRAAISDIKEDPAKRCDLRVHGLRRTYGHIGETHQSAAPVQKSRVLALLADEEAEIVTMLCDLGVDASEEPSR